jgi:hypothetical protein
MRGRITVPAVIGGGIKRRCILEGVGDMSNDELEALSDAVRQCIGEIKDLSVRLGDLERSVSWLKDQLQLDEWY